MTEQIPVRCRIPADCAGLRLDQALAKLLPQFSRARLQQWLKAGVLAVDGRSRQPRDRVSGGEWVSGYAVLETETTARPQPLPLTVVYADAALIVIDKPAGMVVHPAAGNPDGTLVNALLHYAPELAGLPRAGLVHRLDKDTSGLLVVARQLAAHKSLVEQLQARTVGRQYRAVVHGVVTAGGRIDAPLGRHPVDRKRMAVVSGGKPAVTHYRVLARFRAHSYLRITLETGRTHQIRVHMQSGKHPLVGDPLYGGRPVLARGASETLRATLGGFKRQALHAARLELDHPYDGRRLSWQAPLPDDMTALIAALEVDQQAMKNFSAS